MSKKNKHWFIFDNPKEGNKKEYIVEASEIGYEALYTKKSLFKMYSIGATKKDKILAYIYRINQCLKVLFKSSKNDTIICWENTTGLILNWFLVQFKLKRNIVIMTWLSPVGYSKVYENLLFKAINNKRCINVAKDLNCVNQWREYSKKTCSNFVCIPDVHDGDSSFEEIGFSNKEDYCFIGGVNNRDWRLVAEIARECEEVKFICAARKEDFEEQVFDKPQNIVVYYDTNVEDYYSLMKKAKLVLLPLKENQVSGLINILKSAQFGLLCCSTNYDFTKMYYETDKYLIDSKDSSTWIKMVKNVFDMCEDEYVKEAKIYQNYIKINFSTQRVVDELRKIINSFNETQ